MPRGGGRGGVNPPSLETLNGNAGAAGRHTTQMICPHGLNKQCGVIAIALRAYCTKRLADNRSLNYAVKAEAPCPPKPTEGAHISGYPWSQTLPLRSSCQVVRSQDTLDSQETDYPSDAYPSDAATAPPVTKKVRSSVLTHLSGCFCPS